MSRTDSLLLTRAGLAPRGLCHGVIALVALLSIGVWAARAEAPVQAPQRPKVPKFDPRLPAEPDRPLAAARLVLLPSRIEVARGSVVRLSLAVLGARDVSRLPVTLRYDPALLQPTSVRLSAAWRDAKPVLLHDASRPGELVIGVARLRPSATGPAGTAELLEVEFRALRAGSGEIRMERFALIGADSVPQPASASVVTIAVR